MAKAQLTAALTLAVLFGLPVAAHAATHAPVAPSSVAIFSEPEDGDNEDAEGSDDSGSYEGEDDGAFDDGDQDSDDSQFVVPPVVVHPDGGKGHAFNETGSHIPDDKAFGDGGETGEVTSGTPIQLERVAPTAKTPTDVFVDTAVIGLGAVGAGALTLGGMVGVRAIRAKRNGQKADYFYGD